MRQVFELAQNARADAKIAELEQIGDRRGTIPSPACAAR
jgi:hypothetical protein